MSESIGVDKLIKYIRENCTQVDRKSEDFHVDMMFFGLHISSDASKDELLKLINYQDSNDIRKGLIDGKEHSYLEIGGMIGDQGLALCLMGLGSHLGLWKLMTPKNMLGNLVKESELNQLAGMGYISIQSEVKV